jgi:heavy metal sensor kinase
MRSIRLSLVFYFLALLALALGAVSALVFRTAHQTLLAKKDATQKLLEAQYRERREKEDAKLNDELHNQARLLRGITQFQIPARLRNREFYTPVGLVASAPMPNGQFLMAAYVAEGARGGPGPGPSERIARDIAHEMVHRLWTFEISFAESDRHLEEGTYFQVNTNWQTSYRSPSLETNHWSLPFDPTMFTEDRSPGEDPDNVVLAPGHTVRRVLLKVSTTAFPRRQPPPGGWPLRGPSGEAKPPAPPPPMTIQPAGIVIQCARDTTELEAKLAELRADHETYLARLDEGTNASLLALRNRLLAIALATFAAAAVGSFALVRLGLAPLRRLSDAVSQVSPRDFRLPLDRRRLPCELTGIADRLTQTLDMLKRAFAREKQAAADISHELRTPLAALLTTTEVALRKPRAAEEYREILEDCRESGQQMSRLVERLLTLSRLDAGVDTLRVQAVDVAALAEQCAALVRPLAEARSLRLSVRHGGPASLRADPDKLREVLTNLLHNAIEYNRPEGSIDVAVARDNGHLRLEVRDTGIGIAPEARAHIFERFFRADPSRHAEGLHAGLGLAIVKGYVDLMGGTIAVDSAPGQGSTFRIELPADPGEGLRA